jgi:hypothetical protein
MKSNTPIEVKGIILSPAVIELILLGLCIFFSAVALGYEIYNVIKAYRERKQRKIGNCQIPRLSTS